MKQHNIFGFNNNANIPPQDNRGINPFGAIDVDNSGGTFNGRLYVAYSDVNNGAAMATSDIYVARSTDGMNWTEVKVNDDATSTAQFHPFLVVDQTNGSVAVGWHDARNDTASNRKVDYFMSRSTDGGVSWEANTKVSQPSAEFNNSGISHSDENTTDNTGGNPNQYGEYLGVDAHNGKAYMAWTDTRHFFPNSTGNTQRENLGFAVVTFTGSGDITPPTTNITSPTGGATVSGTIPVNADASDNIGVTKVEFYRDGTNLIDTDFDFPYSVNWNTTTTSNGSHNLTSKAYDAANNTGTSTQVNVNISNADTTPPTTSITSPTGGSSVNGTIQVKAIASDNVGIKKVQFYVNGTTLIGSDSSSPYQVNWNTNTVANGNHNLTSKATDTSNNVATSSAVNVTVNNITNCTLSNQIVTNPGFESGNTGWSRSSSTGNNSGIITNGTNRAPHSGTWYAHLNGLAITNTQTITTNSTTMVIPAEVCAASLSFWQSIDTAETTATSANDTVKIQINVKKPNGSFGSWVTLATYSNLEATGMNIYTQKSIDLMTYAGKTVKIRFQGIENSSLQTTFLFDDIALNVTQ
ncbi:Ig-like domain-containing protein [bacterium]|nr:Ig-like domain-containing protein [bacterium]